MEFLLTSDIQAIANGLGADAHRLNGKTILLSGGRGFLGRYFIAVFRELNRTVLERPCKVIALDNITKRATPYFALKSRRRSVPTTLYR